VQNVAWWNPSSIVRTVNENAKVLRFQTFGFEEE
jgi:hypothetical protein